VSYTLVSTRDSLLVEVRHEPGDNPDSFIDANGTILRSVSRVHFRVWEFDRDSAFLGLIQALIRAGTEVLVTPETRRAQGVVEMFGFKRPSS